MNRDGGHLELGPPGALIQGLDVRQLVDVTQVAGIDLPLGERVEHEGVVGVGAVSDVDGASHGVKKLVLRSLLRSQLL